MTDKQFKEQRPKASKKAQYLQLALGMVGVACDYIGCELILETQKAMEKMGNDFDLKTAASIKAKIDKKFN